MRPVEGDAIRNVCGSTASPSGEASSGTRMRRNMFFGWRRVSPRFPAAPERAASGPAWGRSAARPAGDGPDCRVPACWGAGSDWVSDRDRASAFRGSSRGTPTPGNPDARAARLGETDGDGLLGILGPVLPLPHVPDLL